MTIAIDFDGTCVTHKFPKIGEDIGAIPVLKKLVKNGHKLVLNTMRSGDQLTESENNTLKEAVYWFKNNNIPLYGVNKNPEQSYWTSSPKVYADLYIDDAALGCPLLYNNKESRSYVDWNKVEKMLSDLGII